MKRADFLRRLPAPTPGRAAVLIPPIGYRDTDPRDPAALLERFEERWRALGGQVSRAAVADIAAAVATVVAGRAPVLVADDPLLAAVSADLRWPQCGVDGAAQASVAVVPAIAALAATGSVVLDSQVCHGRSAALLAPQAIFVVGQSTVVAALGDVIRRSDEYWPQGLPSQLVVASGPSRSADIEHTLTRGVHGPGDVHAILVS
jgi:L-lactate utilization protein LutC